MDNKNRNNPKLSGLVNGVTENNNETYKRTIPHIDKSFGTFLILRNKYNIKQDRRMNTPVTKRCTSRPPPNILKKG